MFTAPALRLWLPLSELFDDRLLHVTERRAAKHLRSSTSRRGAFGATLACETFVVSETNGRSPPSRRPWSPTRPADLRGREAFRLLGRQVSLYVLYVWISNSRAFVRDRPGRMIGIVYMLGYQELKPHAY